MVVFDYGKTTFPSAFYRLYVCNRGTGFKPDFAKRYVKIAVNGLISKGKKLFKVVAPSVLFHAVKVASGIDIEKLKDADVEGAFEGADFESASEQHR